MTVIETATNYLAHLIKSDKLYFPKEKDSL